MSEQVYDGMPLTFTQACAGDVVEMNGVLYLVKQKCQSQRYLMVVRDNTSTAERMSEYDFNQAGATWKASAK